MQAEPRPSPPPRRFSSCSRCVVIRAPVAPSGWVSAIAPPFDVDLRSRSRPSSSLDRYVLRGEGLVDLDQIDVVQGEAGLVQRLARRGRRPDPHDARWDPGDGPRDEAAHGREAVGRRELGVGDHEGGRPVPDSARVSGRDQPVLLEVGSEGRPGPLAVVSGRMCSSRFGTPISLPRLSRVTGTTSSSNSALVPRGTRPGSGCERRSRPPRRG